MESLEDISGVWDKFDGSKIEVMVYLKYYIMDFYITGLEGYFSPSAYLGHSVISYHFKTTYLNLTKFSGNMDLRLVNLDFEKL